MEKQPKTSQVILMPGLDGTGNLFEPIIAILENHFCLKVIQYQDQCSFEELVESVECQLPPNEPISIIAESFSTPIAIEILARNKFNFQASVLSTGFCRTPMEMFAPLIGFMPDKVFSIETLSKIILNCFAVDKHKNHDLEDKCIEALRLVSSTTMKKRLKIIADVNVCNQLSKIDISMLYIRASHDRIISKNKSLKVVSELKIVEEVIVAGPHLILQSNPKACAEHIIRHINS